MNIHISQGEQMIVMFAVFVALALIAGLTWIFLDATARFGVGQGITWSFLYLAGVCFFGLGQLVIVALWLSSRPRKPADIYRDLSTLLPNAPAKLKHCFWDTGIAVDPGGKHVALVRRGLTKSYSYADVREYRWNIQQGGQLVGASPFHFGILATNRRTNRSNHLSTGLFLKVRDIDAPEWQILFHRKSELMRWYEILNQAFEGHLQTDHRPR